jgi:type I site-specific restriction endonuclease
MKPEERARHKIDQLLQDPEWEIQDHKDLNLGSSLGVAVREFPVSTGFADYTLFVDRKAVGVIEAKPEGTTLNLDIFWIKDESLEDAENLPEPAVLAAEIIENLEAALDQFRGVVEGLENRK